MTRVTRQKTPRSRAARSLGAFVVLLTLAATEPAAADSAIAGVDLGYTGGATVYTVDGDVGVGIPHHPYFASYALFEGMLIDIDWTGLLLGLMLGGVDAIPNNLRGVETGLPGQYGVLARVFRARAGATADLGGFGVGLVLDADLGYAGLSSDQRAGFAGLRGSASNPFTTGGGYLGIAAGPLFTLQSDVLSAAVEAVYGIAPGDVLAAPLQNHVVRLHGDVMFTVLEDLVWLKASALHENRFFLGGKDESTGVTRPFGSLHHLELTGSVVINVFGPLWGLLL